MCACTGPVGTGIGAVCVEYGRPKWPITMLNHTYFEVHTGKCIVFLFLAPFARTTRFEEAFLPEGKKRPRSLRCHGLSSLFIPYMIRICIDNEIIKNDKIALEITENIKPVFFFLRTCYGAALESR